jgi:hypothetical protein
MLLASISSFLGTTWFILLVGVIGFISGVYFSDKVKALLGR